MKRFLYFNTNVTDRLTRPRVDTKAEVGRLTSSTISDAYSWVDLNKQLLQGNIPDVIACGTGQMFEKDPEDFLVTLHTIINSHCRDKKITLCAPANTELTFDRISRLKELGFKGLVPPTPYYGSQASARSINHFLNDQEYWPEHIIQEYKTAKIIPRVVVFNNKIKLENELTLSAYKFFLKLQQNKNCRIDIAHTWDELSLILRKNPSTVLFHSELIEDSAQEFVETLESLIKFTHTQRKANIGAIITKQTSLSLIKELQQTKVTGIVPGVNHFGDIDAEAGILNVINNIPYWPKHILKQLPGQNVKSKKHNIELSYRQQQILNLIQTRGITNQQIADSLKIKEGTVKLHVGVLLKKYGVQNRTQLANL